MGLLKNFPFFWLVIVRWFYRHNIQTTDIVGLREYLALLDRVKYGLPIPKNWMQRIIMTKLLKKIDEEMRSIRGVLMVMMRVYQIQQKKAFEDGVTQLRMDRENGKDYPVIVFGSLD